MHFWPASKWEDWSLQKHSRYTHTSSLNVALVTDDTDGGGREDDEAAVAAAAVSNACSSAVRMMTTTKAVQNGVRWRQPCSWWGGSVHGWCLVVGLRGRRRGGRGRGGQQAVRARGALRSRLLGGVAWVGGVQARTAFCHLRFQLGRTLKVDAVEHLDGAGGIKKKWKKKKTFLTENVFLLCPTPFFFKMYVSFFWFPFFSSFVCTNSLIF